MASNPVLPEFYRGKTFDKESQFRLMYGTQASKRDKKRFERYWDSAQRWSDQDAFERREHRKVIESWYARAAARKQWADQQHQSWMAQYATTTQPEIQKDEPVKPVNKPEQPVSVTITPEQWAKHMTDLGYTQGKTSTGSIMFKDDQNNLYYDNGRARINGKMSDYDYSTLTGVKQPQTQTRIIASEVVNNNIPELKGRKNEYSTETELEMEFANLYNQHVLNDKYKILPQTAHKVRNQIKQEAGYDEAWQAFRNKYEKTGNGLTSSYVYKNKQGGTMNRINYFQAGGAAPQQAAQAQDVQKQVIALVQAAMQGDQKATQTVNKIMEAAKAGDKQAMQIAQMIQKVAQKMQGQATAAKWGTKLSYIRSLKYAHGGKTCPTCQKGSKVKVAYKDIDKETYKKLSTDKQRAASMHAEHNASEYHKDGTYKIVHKPTAEDSTTIDKKHLSVNMKKKYTDKKECGGKAKKRYFGGWL